jgi:hypothetical protein
MGVSIKKPETQGGIGAGVRETKVLAPLVTTTSMTTQPAVKIEGADGMSPFQGYLGSSANAGGSNGSGLGMMEYNGFPTAMATITGAQQHSMGPPLLGDGESRKRKR